MDTNRRKYLDNTISIEERIEDLLNRMTIEEKLSQMRFRQCLPMSEEGFFSPEKAERILGNSGIGGVESRDLKYGESARFFNALQEYL